MHGSTVWHIHWTTRLIVFHGEGLLRLKFPSWTLHHVSCTHLHSTGFVLISSGHGTKKEPPWISFFLFIPSLLFFFSHIDFPTTLRSGKMPPTRTQGCKHCFVSLARYGKKEGLRKETESPAYTQTHKINADQCFISLRRSYSRPELPEGKKKNLPITSGIRGHHLPLVF